ncbi:MAG: glycerophosphodiester phosphodiesterase family protein [Bacilli bacterium]|nr:glycerophosphodiester phosphodiesterase family protein [Bacilli bacterium]MDD4795380.1 glycerophosphodiester phosphodiesterase family protein [Bacilli bacterium]
MKFIAHRGLYNDDIGENTLSAIDNAFANGFYGVEVDLRKTKDNQVVLIHDSFISRVSDGFGLVKNFTYNKLLKYNFGKKNIERVPLLKNVISKYKDRFFLLELKEKINIEELNLDNNNIYYISSFNYSYINNLPKSNKYKKGIINYVFNTNINLKNIDFIMILDSFITDKVFEYYENNNIEVIVYGVGNKINLNLSKENRLKVKYVI